MLHLLLGLSGCAPRYGAAPPLAPDDLASPLPVQKTSVDGVEIAYADAGSGRAVVFVHGLSSYMGYWDRQLPNFTNGFRVLALDLPGFGMSSRPDAPYTPPWYGDVLVQWMDAVGLESAVLVGHSMGGQIALTVALDHPDRVDGLVLSAPAGFETFDRGHADWMKSWWTESRALETGEAEVRAAFTTSVFNVADDHVEQLIEERVRLGRHEAFGGTSVAVSRSIAGMLDHPVRHRLDELDVPTLVVFGTDDRMIPNPVFNGGRTRAIAEDGTGAIKGAELLMIPGAGHTVHHDAPGAFNGALSEFLEAL